MANIDVKCPACSHEFPLSDGVLSSLRDDMKGELQSALAEQKKRLDAEAKAAAESARQRAASEAETELKLLRKELDESDEALKKAKALELETMRKQKELAAQAEAMQLDIEKQVQVRLDKEAAELEERIRAKAAEENSGALEAAKQEIAEQKQALATAREAEAALLKKERELQAKAEQIELETQRQLAAQRESIRKEALDQANEAHHLKVQEYEKKLADAAKAKDDLARKLEQGSQQTQGDVLEIDIKNKIQQAFVMDRIEDVPTGIRGADLIQTVVNPIGQDCGQIVIETKRTQNFTQAWLPKLKEDLARVKGDVPVIISSALPDGVSSFDYLDGVWVCSISHAVPLLSTLRWSLIELARTKSALAGMEDNKDVLYAYFTGPEFRNRVASIVENFNAMRATLEAERKALTKHWAAREKQIDKVTLQLSGMQGDIQGITHERPEALDFSLEES